MRIFPNPFNEIINIQYRLNMTFPVNIEVIDALGRNIKTLVKSTQVEGEYSYCFDGKKEDLQSEIYFIKMNINNTVYVKKIIKRE